MYEYYAKVLKVIDGDTIDVEINLGFSIIRKERVRIANIDAYETSLRGGTTQAQKQIGLKGKKFLNDLILNKKVILRTQKESGKYGRYIAFVYGMPSETHPDTNFVYDEKNRLCVGNTMVKSGFAVWREY